MSGPKNAEDIFKFFEGARTELPVTEILEIIESTRCAAISGPWREACDCVEDLIIMRSRGPNATAEIV